jgi:acylphosphatase
MKHIRHVLISGRVQGVGFRMWTEEEALDRGLVGWVRNRRDGSVEALFAGPAEAVADMVEACWQGPPGARVEAVDAQAAGEDALGLGYPEQRFSVLATV